MPKVSYANPDIKLSYMNGHYCYALKTSIVTNGLGIIRDIDFLNDKSTNITEAATASEAKDTYDSKSLIPTLNKFFSKHDFKYKYFLGDASFDAVDNYNYAGRHHLLCLYLMKMVYQLAQMIINYL